MLRSFCLGCLIFCLSIFVQPAEAAPACAPKYVGQLLLQPDANGRSMTVKAPFAYRDKGCFSWQVPKNAAVDGASIPRTLWTVIGGPWDGLYRNASVIHDWFCAVRTKPWRDVHRMFYEAMLTSGVGRKTAHLMYLAVYYGGPRWDDITIRNSKLIGHQAELTPSVSQALTSVRGAIASGNLASANIALAAAQGAMQTNGDQYAVADVTRALSVAVNDKATEAAAVDAMISSGIPDADALGKLYSERATIAYVQGDRDAAVKNARAALSVGDLPDATELIAQLKQEGFADVERRDASDFEPNPLEFKRLANIVAEKDLGPEEIEKLVDATRESHAQASGSR